jgi:DNA-binding LytR/AlgR family response regulator
MLPLLLLGQLTMANAADMMLVSVDFDSAIICPISSSQSSSLNRSGGSPFPSDRSIVPPSFNEPECRTQSATRVDPQDSALWVKFALPIPEKLLNNEQPMSVYVSGKTSSRVYFNGAYLGQNGTPSFNPNEEFPGKIDAMFYVPPSLLKSSDNHIILQLSSHHGFIKLTSPINFIGFGSYAGATSLLQQNIGLSFVPLGALVLGALYFFVASFSSHNRRTNRLFLAMCLLAGSQLFAEISRALFAYSYPFHDLRLILITTFSQTFGILLLYFITLKLNLEKATLWTLIGASISVVCVFLVPGFDPKTAVGILIPSCFCTGLIAFSLYKQPSKEKLISLLTFVVFIVIVILTLSRFHDILFYYIITLVLAILFVQQALKLNSEQKQRQLEQQQLIKLQLILEQNQQQQQPKKLSINSAGKVELIASDAIIYCKAAGDYAELFLKDNKQILFSGTLKELESQLPGTFLRVHRSFLVNMEHIVSLNNKSQGSAKVVSGGGFLILTGDHEVPVSRRIIPQVRNAIT